MINVEEVKTSSNMKRRGCPVCKSSDTAEYIYGLVVFDEELERQEENNEVIIGGCSTGPGAPDYHCNNCGVDFTRRNKIVEPSDELW